MTERKRQILQTAIEMIADEGYGCLSMRALARASGIKLGALQYHFRTSEDMLRALVGYIAESYQRSFESLTGDQSPGIREIVIFILNDEAGETLIGDRLWPQLWAMQQVEPLVSDLLEDIYAKYVQTLEQALEDAGNSALRAEALCLMSMLEGSTIFLGSGRRWEGDAKAVRDTLLEFIDNRYGKKS
ncbi:MAG: TetR/AcrR family transcriptional regulator [Gammaproteobacteria bacterium]|nr:TetR/AcrR family transcriptional regulator [Gammaproteobacteria bacterium]